MIRVTIDEYGDTDKAFVEKTIRVFGIAVYRAKRTTESTVVTCNFNKKHKITGYATT